MLSHVTTKERCYAKRFASVEQVRNANVLEMIIVDDGSSKADTTRILGEVAEPGHSGDRGYNEDFETCQDLDLFLRLSEVGLVENLPDILLSWR